MDDDEYLVADMEFSENEANDKGDAGSSEESEEEEEDSVDDGDGEQEDAEEEEEEQEHDESGKEDARSPQKKAKTSAATPKGAKADGKKRRVKQERGGREHASASGKAVMSLWACALCGLKWSED